VRLNSRRMIVTGFSKEFWLLPICNMYCNIYVYFINYSPYIEKYLLTSSTYCLNKICGEYRLSGNLVVLGGSAGEHVAIKLGNLLGVEPGIIEVKKFPDGEIYLRIHSDVRGKRVIYVNSLQPDVNNQLAETLIALDTIRDLGVSEIVAVLTYMPYARQDERFNPGEAVSIRTVAKLLKSVNPDWLFTIDMHLHRISDPRVLFGDRFLNLTAIEELAKYFAGRIEPGRTVVIGPDEESLQWASVMAHKLGIEEYTVLDKKRISPQEVVIEARGLEVGSKDVVIVDDIISTGGTIIEAVRALRKLGAEKISVACVHPLLVERAYSKILRLGVHDLVGTDTVLSPISKVSVAPVVMTGLKRIGFL